MTDTKELQEKMKDALNKIDSGEELSKEKIKELLFDAFSLCNRVMVKENQVDYLRDVLREQIDKFKGILGES